MPRRAYRLFEPVGGVASYIRTRRLARARQELTAPGLEDYRIGPIAYRAGFQSIPAFNRAFRAAYGQIPRSTRKRGGGGSAIEFKTRGVGWAFWRAGFWKFHKSTSVSSCPLLVYDLICTGLTRILCPVRFRV
jgi:AraC-like DNA-binding protein